MLGFLSVKACGVGRTPRVLLAFLTLALAQTAGCGAGTPGPFRAAAAARSCTIPLLQRALTGVADIRGAPWQLWCQAGN
ncbi:hypothetical protein T484DRAFT_1763185 [Baffinella frigidus]|nr:hypothetical protein T484DRAFT_1763185 [Cryptophyta sp. CCMP2293]